LIKKIVFILAFSSLPITVNAKCLTEYKRNLYPHWGPSENYADIRQEIIASAVVADLKVISGRVVAGLWYDPFTGKNYRISEVTPDIDHLASLAWVHKRGGKCMSRDRRREIANDPDNLWAVHPSANRQKGSNVTSWLPANLGICADYLKRLKLVVEKYDELKMKRSDIRAYNTMIVKCQDWRNGIKIKKARKWYQVFYAK